MYESEEIIFPINTKQDYLHNLASCSYFCVCFVGNDAALEQMLYVLFPYIRHYEINQITQIKINKCTVLI